MSIEYLLNRKVLFRSIHYMNYILTEYLGDFSTNVFHTKDINHNLTGYNKISTIEKDGDKYKIKIGAYYVCSDTKVACNKTQNKNICIDNKYNEVFCTTCVTTLIKTCQETIDKWEIEKTIMGYAIKNNDMCLTLGYKLYLSECKYTNDQLFDFQDYTLIDCVENVLDKKVETKNDLVDLMKAKKALKNIKNSEPDIYKDLKKKTKEEVDLDGIVPGIIKNPKMKRLWGNLIKFNWSGFPFKGFKLQGFCTKWI